MRTLPGLLAAVAIVAGCVAPAGVEPQGGAPAGPARPVVVAMVDTGIMPYHEAFHLDPSQDAAWLAALPITTVPSGFRAHAGEAEAWQLDRETLYWFEGTRVLAIGQVPERDTIGFPMDNRPIYEDFEHGTMTSSIVARLAPKAWILMVESVGTERPLAWLAGLDWVDLVSVQLAAIAGAPLDLVGDQTGSLLRTLAESNVLSILGAGNDGAPSIIGEDGAPWIVSVGGAHPGSRGASANSGTVNDVVSQFVDTRLADRDDWTGYRTSQGTSFAAPMVSGVLAAALEQLDARLGPQGRGPTAADLREALNRTARYWTPDEYRPQPPPLSGDPEATRRAVFNLSAPMLPAAGPAGPWVEMGWGYVDHETLPPLVEALRTGNLPAKPPDAVAYMERVHNAKRAYWDRPG